MPELPEVETILRGLEPHIIGKRVLRVLARDTRILQNPSRTLKRCLPGQRFLSARRRGKFLIFELERHLLLIHLGMTGQLTFRDPARQDAKRFLRHPVTGLERAGQHAPDRHTHLQVQLCEGGALLLRDVRKFGRVYLRSRRRGAADLLDRLGLEPFTPEYRLEAFLSALRGRKRVIKSLLLDQAFVAGVGNIYADEALFQAWLHPARTVSSLRRWEREALFRAIPRVLEQGIRQGGTTLRDYLDSRGERGSHQEELQVYGRAGQPCRRCGTPIEKIAIGQRGTHFCPACQPRHPVVRSR